MYINYYICYYINFLTFRLKNCILIHEINGLKNSICDTYIHEYCYKIVTNLKHKTIKLKP